MMAHANAKLESVDARARCGARLLDAAGEVFAEVGFRDATVREICRRAGANVAAVNYHFGDKAQLYSETLRHLANQSMQRFPIVPDVAKRANVERRLHAFVESFLLRLFSDEKAALYGRIMARELVEPTHALRERIEESVRPMIDHVAGIVREVLGDRASVDQVRRCGFSVMGQILFYKHTQRVTAHLFPEEKFDRASIDALADHITRFSMAGLKSLATKLAAKV